MEFVKSPYWQDRKGEKIDGIVVHTTVGGYESTISYFKKNDRQVSAHYVISLAGEITQMVEENLGANHAGIVRNPTTSLYRGINPNLHTIGIENADNKNPHEADRSKQLPALAHLVRTLCEKHNIPIDRKHIVGHRELRSDKTCPGNIDVDEVVRLAKGDTIIDVMDEFKEKGIKLLDEYRSIRTTGAGAEGNYESYVRAIIGSDKNLPEAEKTIISVNLQVSGLKTVVDSKDEAINSLKNQNKILEDKITDMTKNPAVQKVLVEPTFTNRFAKQLYILAKLIEGGNDAKNS